MKKIIAVLGIATALLLTGCTAASTASYNVSQASDNFEVQRPILFKDQPNE